MDAALSFPLLAGLVAVAVGAARRVSAVRWGLAGNIVIAWLITMPAAAFIAALFYVVAGLSL
jgi:inorganic phosphate transporter, PiT family